MLDHLDPEVPDHEILAVAAHVSIRTSRAAASRERATMFETGAVLSRRARREEFRSLDELQVRARWGQRVGNDVACVA